LIDQAFLVSKELIRVAILWHELWYEGLEEASRLFYGEKNVSGMLQTLAPLHAMLEQGPETLREVSFQQSYGRELQEALEWCKKYQRSGNSAEMQQAWDIYYHVFRRIHKQLPLMTTLELQFVSPKLQEQKGMDIAVPGTYRSGHPVIKIARVHPVMTVITSKQRPRKLTIIGSNEIEYKFLLKGHEDLRQDERVMQLFGLVNNLLENNSETSKSHLSIGCYAVIPLSPNSGLIGWVPHSDTLHLLIREYRDSRQILLNIEHRLMLQMAPAYDQLTLPQKVEVFQYALDTTDGQDLERVLWLKSSSSEVWLERRTNYTRSVAVMSMVGYILGLGDRHPSNLMLDRYTGQVVHIDFGDCFEVAMHREKYPEKIPFRLTRMLVNAMEVSGIEGNYRFTCEKVMHVLRDNRDSLMAVLEAFVYDPLINWRLLSHASPEPSMAATATATAAAAAATPSVSSPPATGSAGSSIGEWGDRQLQQQLEAAAMSTSDTDRPAVRVGGGGRSKEALDADAAVDKADPLNERALNVIKRVSKKLTGRDFGNIGNSESSPGPHSGGGGGGVAAASTVPSVGRVGGVGSGNSGGSGGALDVRQQVDKLIKQATSHENLCQCYIGWCPFW
jgi:FKBP12-rapamycin complex-associated protein